MDWLKALDLELALENLKTETAGDWYRDPWGWPELGWLVSSDPSFVVTRLEQSGVRAFVPLDVPKENFAMRPAVVLDPVDRLCYQALVDRLSKRLIGDLPSFAYGWRLPVRDPQAGRWARNNKQWDYYRKHLGRAAQLHDSALTTDIVSFFGSIPLEPLSEQIESRGSNELSKRLTDMLAGWYRATGRGLPQRSTASAALAHLYLKPLDDALSRQARGRRRLGRILPDGRSMRWMDDIWVFGHAALDLRDTQVVLQSVLRGLRLEMNLGKTDVLEGDDLMEAVYEIEHSAVDKALVETPPDPTPLGELVTKLTAAPETASRTSVRFAAKRVRNANHPEYAAEFAEVADRMPHGSDHLARLFKDTEVWRDLQEWYIGYARAWRSRLPWSVGQLATMFPSEAKADGRLVDEFGAVLEKGEGALPVLSVTAQRFAAWRPEDARPLLQERAASEAHPLAMRSLALAAIHAGETRQGVRKMLRQHEENAATLAMLDDQSFDKKHVAVTPDFG